MVVDEGARGLEQSLHNPAAGLSAYGSSPSPPLPSGDTDANALRQVEDLIIEKLADLIHPNNLAKARKVVSSALEPLRENSAAASHATRSGDGGEEGAALEARIGTVVEKAIAKALARGVRLRVVTVYLCQIVCNHRYYR